MLEALVSSRVRRTLFEYVVSHPRERFYLRGLAKALGLSITPLRRELKRLERSGVLKAVQEANILFYTVHTDSPAFLQLQRAVQQTQAPSPVASSLEDAIDQPFSRHGAAPLSGAASRTGTGQIDPQAIPIAVLSARPSPEAFSGRSPLRGPLLIGVAGAGMMLMLVIAGLFYLTITNQRLVSQASRALATRKADVAVVAPHPRAAGTMRGARWQIVPGGFGGFSSGASDESY